MHTHHSPLQETINALLQNSGYHVAFIECRGATIDVALEDAEGKGPTLDTCTKLHKLLRTQLMQDGLLTERTLLEIGSPGLDRPLYTYDDYKRFEGSLVNIVLRKPLDNLKRLSGTIVSVRTSGFTLRLNAPTASAKKPHAPETLELEYTQIRHCKLAPVL